MTAGLLCFHIPAAIIEPLLKRNDKLVGWQAIGCWLAINIALSVANLVWVWRRIEGVDGPVGLEVFIPLLLGVAFAGVSVFQPFLSAVFLSRWRPESESPTIHAVWGSCAGILALLPLCLIAAAAWVLCFPGHEPMLSLLTFFMLLMIKLGCGWGALLGAVAGGLVCGWLNQKLSLRMIRRQALTGAAATN